MKLWLRRGIFSYFISYILRNFPVAKGAPVFGTPLVQRLSGGIDPRLNGIWQEKRRKERCQRLSVSMLSVKQIIVKSATQSIPLHCDAIRNIQHLPIRRSDCQYLHRQVPRMCPRGRCEGPQGSHSKPKKIFIFGPLFFGRGPIFQKKRNKKGFHLL